MRGAVSVSRLRAFALGVEHEALIAMLLGWVLGVVSVVQTGAWWLVSMAPHVWSTRSTHFTVDPLSPLPIRDGAWDMVAWIPGLVVWSVERVSGVTGLSILSGVLCSLILAGLYRMCRSVVSPPIALTAVVMAIPLLTPLTLESQLFALVLFVGTMLAVRGSLWMFAPFLLILWANTHGSVPIGVLVCLAAALGMLDSAAPIAQANRGKRLLFSAACMVAPLINPQGTDLIRYIGTVSTLPALHEFAWQWRSTSPFSSVGLYLCLISILGCAGALGSGRARAVPVIVALTMLAYSASRHIQFVAIFATPFVASFLATRFPAETRAGSTAWKAWECPRNWGMGLTLGMLVVTFPGGPIHSWTVLRGTPDATFKALPLGELAYVDTSMANRASIVADVPVWIDARLERYTDVALRNAAAVNRGDPKAVASIAGCIADDSSASGNSATRFGVAVNPRMFLLKSRAFQRVARSSALREKVLRREADWVTFAVECRRLQRS